MPPRVRIPQSPPMCDKCLKRAQGKEIINLQLKIEKLFKKIDGNTSLQSDYELIRLLELMAEKVDQYRKK